jgi:hypothetical protein
MTIAARRSGPGCGAFGREINARKGSICGPVHIGRVGLKGGAK